MQNIKSLPHKTKNLHPGHSFLQMEVESQGLTLVQQPGYVTYCLEVIYPHVKLQKSSHKMKQLQPGHKLVIKKTIIWPWCQSSRSKVTNHGMRCIILRWSIHALVKYQKPICKTKIVIFRTRYVMDVRPVHLFRLKGHSQGAMNWPFGLRLATKWPLKGPTLSYRYMC